jgi:hypothetical protein
MADDLNKELSRAEKILKDRLTATSKIARDITNQAFRELVNSIEEYTRSLDEITDALEDQLGLYSSLKKQTKELGETLNRNLSVIEKNKDLSQRLVGIYKDQNNLIDKLARNQEDLLTGELSLKQVNQDLIKAKSQVLNIELRQVDIGKEIEKQESELIGASEKEKDLIGSKILALQEIHQSLQEEKKTLGGITDELNKQAKSARSIENKVGVGGKLLSGFKKIPVLGDLLDIEGAGKAMQATAAQGGSYFKTLGSGISTLGPSLMKALGPLAIIDLLVKGIKFFIDAMFAADERVTKLAKGMSLTKDEARGVYNSLKETKLSIESIYNLTKDVTEAFTDLVDLTGFVTSATDEMIEAQIVLTKNIGLSKEEAFGVQEAFVVNNVNAKEGYNIVNDQLAAFANQNKLLSTGKVIFNDIAKTSKLIQINFNGNLGALVKTTLEAKKLGLSLDQVSKIGSSLLNFEESISSELEAELLTGRDINLEKARLYALNHDIAGLTQEISRQGITQDSFSKMNVIQQEAIAKSLGMSAEEMGDMLYKQKVLEKVGGQTLKDLRERAKATKDINLQNKVDALEQGILSGKSFEESEKAASAQEKFNQALEQAKEAFTDFVDGGFLDLLADAIKEFADMMLSAEDKEKKAAKRGEEMRNSEEYKKYTPEQQKYIDEQQKAVEESQVGMGGKFISMLMPDILGIDYYGDLEKYRKTAEERLQQIKSKGFEGTTTNIKKDEEPITTPPTNMVYKDFTIRTLPEDTVVGMGGTSLGRTDEMVKLLIQQNQHLDKQNNLLSAILNKEGTIVLNGTKMGTAMAVGGYKVA